MIAQIQNIDKINSEISIKICGSWKKNKGELIAGSKDVQYFYWCLAVLADQNKHKKVVESFEIVLEFDD